MRGFLRRTTVDQALAWVDRLQPPGVNETVPLAEAYQRVLAVDVTANSDVPEFDRAAMDGFALRGAESTGAGAYNPLEFAVIGDSLPGRPYSGTVASQQAVRIMTGAPLPPGTDAVVPAEFVQVAGDRVAISAPTPPGKHVGRTGEDIRAGTVVLRAGRRLRPQDAGVLASLGIDQTTVIRRPRVRIIVTGNELVPPGSPKGPHEIYEANSVMLCGLVARDGSHLESCVRVRDDRIAIREALGAAGAEVILISGGSSVGAEDHAPGLVAELGELAIHGVAMRPSSPTGLGRIGSTAVCLLPGNPVSCLCAYEFFAGRLIRRWGGRDPEWPHRQVRGVLQQKIVSAIGRVDYCRVCCDEAGVGGSGAVGRPASTVGKPATTTVRPLALGGASILSSTTRADGFVIVPAELEGYARGRKLMSGCTMGRRLE
jgi:molybdopterin molybdotransferase